MCDGGACGDGVVMGVRVLPVVMGLGGVIRPLLLW